MCIRDRLPAQSRTALTVKGIKPISPDRRLPPRAPNTALQSQSDFTNMYVRLWSVFVCDGAGRGKNSEKAGIIL